MTNQTASEYLKGWSGWSKLYHPHDFEVFTLKTLFPELSQLKVLEVGCGDGRVSQNLVGECSKVTAIDIEKDLIEQLAKSNSNLVEYFEMSGTELLFPDNSFDLILFSWSLHQMKPMITPLKEAFRCLKESGHLVIFGLTEKGQYDDVIEEFGKNPGHHITQSDEFIQSVTEVFGKPRIEKRIGNNSEFGFKFDNDEIAVKNWLWSLENWHSYEISTRDEEKILSIMKNYKKDNGYFLDIYGTLIVVEKKANN